MRYHMTEKALATIASRIARTITIRNYVNGSSEDVTRESTFGENDFIFKTAFGALLGLNYGETVRNDKNAEQAILDSSEFIINQFLNHCNGYDTLYNKLRAVLEAWKAHEKTPSEWSLRMMWRMFPEEISCLDDWLVYADPNELETMTTVEDAQVQIEGMRETLEDNDETFPEELGDPHIMMLLWNLYIKTPGAVSVGG